MTARLYIHTSRYLVEHVIFDVSPLRRDTYERKVKKDYSLDHLEHVYSADATYSSYFGLEVSSLSLADVTPELKELLEISKSKLGKTIFRLEVDQLLSTVVNEYSKNLEVHPNFSSAVMSKLTVIEKRARAWKRLENDSADYLSKYQLQFDNVNRIWEDFWESKLDVFRGYIIANSSPDRRYSIFFDGNNQKQYDDQLSTYESTLFAMTSRWREETKKLPTTLSIDCRVCRSSNAVALQLSGPGNSYIYEGENENTITSREFLDKPEYKKKLKDGRRYYWRHLISFDDVCKFCRSNILAERQGAMIVEDVELFGNLSKFKNNDRCSIYQYDDHKSWFEWCGVWMTAFEWFVYESHGRNDLSGYFFFDEYNRQNQLR